MVGAVIDYLQNRDDSHRWIKYSDLYQRNVKLVNSKRSFDDFIVINGLDERTFFGVNSYEVIRAMSTKIVENLVLEYWDNKDYYE